MNKFFKKRNKTLIVTDISQNEIIVYKELVITEMSKMGASEDGLCLVEDATIRNSIRKNKKPEDVAWAILQ